MGRLAKAMAQGEEMLGPLGIRSSQIPKAGALGQLEGHYFLRLPRSQECAGISGVFVSLQGKK